MQKARRHRGPASVRACWIWSISRVACAVRNAPKVVNPRRSPGIAASSRQGWMQVIGAGSQWAAKGRAGKTARSFSTAAAVARSRTPPHP
eukprot:3938862-Rhodomonas_salina.2